VTGPDGVLEKYMAQGLRLYLGQIPYDQLKYDFDHDILKKKREGDFYESA